MEVPKVKPLCKPAKGDNRTLAQIREHYEIERELADRLRRATREERSTLYGKVYDELFARVPHHTQIAQKHDAAATAREVEWQLCLLRPWLKMSTTFLEFGAGACSLSLAVCPFAKQVYAADVSAFIAANADPPLNFKLILLSGSKVPLAENTVEVAYSNQLLEHLHPEDAMEHLQDMYRVLKPGGAYVCVTPNRVSGPWDISRYFDTEATGFHLKEYSVGELVRAYRTAGFKRVFCYAGARKWFLPMPARPIRLFEILLDSIPFAIRAPIARSLPGRALLGIRIVGIK